MGITPDSGKAPHVYASRGASEPIEAGRAGRAGQDRIGQGRAGQGKHTCSARDGLGPQEKVTSGGSSEEKMDRVVREVKVAVPARAGKSSGPGGKRGGGRGT